MDEMLKCHRCGDVIGVYEPLVRFVEGRAVETSRLLEPHVGGEGERCFHSGCAEHRPELPPAR